MDNQITLDDKTISKALTNYQTIYELTQHHISEEEKYKITKQIELCNRLLHVLTVSVTSIPTSPTNQVADKIISTFP